MQQETKPSALQKIFCNKCTGAQGALSTDTVIAHTGDHGAGAATQIAGAQGAAADQSIAQGAGAASTSPIAHVMTLGADTLTPRVVKIELRRIAHYTRTGAELPFPP
mmetsp:Transcript_66382/g.128423  ORF Transcript_66382/g.128423 Transcript_66382/m.128423 type:complete len:107 (+) Transcript_66382:2017-2337(+)